MEIPIKFKLFQNVWINEQIKAKQISVKAVRVLCTYQGYTGENWGDTDSKGGGWPFRVQYSTESNPKDDQWISQELLFASKDELLKSL